MDLLTADLYRLCCQEPIDPAKMAAGLILEFDLSRLADNPA